MDINSACVMSSSQQPNRTSSILTAASTSSSRRFCHIYLRVSSGEQADTGNSLEFQRSACRDYAARHGLVIKDVYVDAGISGRKLDRPELNRMRASVEQGEHIVAYSIARLSRSVIDFHGIAKWAEEHDITVHTVKENIDTKSANGIFLIHMFSSLAQLEANQTQERMAEINTRKIRRGETTKAPPFGYRSVKYKVGMPARLIPDVIEQTAISRMFDLRWKEQFHKTSYKEIADILTREGHRPRRSQKFTVESVRQTMTREYEFRMRVHKTINIPTYIIQRYVQLCMPFIVPMEEMEKYVVTDEDGRSIYNGQYEDKSIVAEKIHFYTKKTSSSRNKRGAMTKTATILDLHLMLYDRERECEMQVAQLMDRETIARRMLCEEEAKSFRSMLEKIVSEQMRLDVLVSEMRETLTEELKMAQIRQRLYLEEKKGSLPAAGGSTTTYDENDDMKALEMRLTIMSLTKKLAQCSIPQGKAIALLHQSK